jgi:two-component system OmpR family response regulator
MINYLLVDDDLEIAQLIINALASEGYTATYAPNGPQAIRLLEHTIFDFIIQDLMMPGIAGLELYRQIRDLSSNAPIIIVSGLSSTEERISGLRAGCDEYITKPFSQAELQIRVHNVLKFSRKQKEATTVAYGDLRLFRISRTVLQKGKRLSLAKMEFILLELLLMNPNKIISKEQILKDVFCLTFIPPTNIVDVLVCRLRSKLDSENSSTAIVTVRGLGYTLKLNDFGKRKFSEAQIPFF